MKVRTAAELNQALADELIWRRKELTSFKLAYDRIGGSSFLRAWIALLYAHWEGFIKQASAIYLEYVGRQRLHYNQLSAVMVALSLRGKLRAASESNRIRSHIEVVQLLLGGLDQQGEIPRAAVATKGNLSSRILRDLVDALGLDYRPFETKAELIDARLVEQRNTIAHGEHLAVELPDVEKLHAEIIAMLDNFRTQVDNAASGGAFRAGGAGP